MTFEQIKKNFDRGLWNEIMLRKCVDKGVITEKQFEEIVYSE